MNDEKIAADYKVQGGSVLHLVLALRGSQYGTVCQLYFCFLHLLQSQLSRSSSMQNEV